MIASMLAAAAEGSVKDRDPVWDRQTGMQAGIYHASVWDPGHTATRAPAAVHSEYVYRGGGMRRRCFERADDRSDFDTAAHGAIRMSTQAHIYAHNLDKQ